jgi:hypothetical protein
LLKGTLAAAAAGVATSALGAQNTLQQTVPGAAPAAPAGGRPPIFVSSADVSETANGIIIQNPVLAAGVRNNREEALRLIWSVMVQDNVRPNDVSVDAAGRVVIAGNPALTRWRAIKGTTAWNIICNGNCGIGVGTAATVGQPPR